MQALEKSKHCFPAGYQCRFFGCKAKNQALANISQEAGVGKDRGAAQTKEGRAEQQVSGSAGGSAPEPQPRSTNLPSLRMGNLMGPAKV